MKRKYVSNTDTKAIMAGLSTGNIFDLYEIVLQLYMKYSYEFETVDNKLLGYLH